MPEGSQTEDRFASLSALLVPRSVAVIGASADPRRIGGRPIAYMRARGFGGAILPVNPKRAEIQGFRTYPDIASLPFVPDVAIVALPAALVEAAVAELAALGVRGVVVFSAGFAEVDEAGAASQARIAATAHAAGMRLLGPNALGLFNARIGWFATFSASLESFWPIHGRIAIASQSGAFGTHLFAAAATRGLGTPICVTTGNEADVTLGEAIGWLAADPGTDVIAAAAEGVRKPETFLAALAAARAARKPVIVMKAGRSALGQQSARSHTAAIAGDDAVFNAVLAEFGAVRAECAEQLLDFAYAATQRVYPARNTLGVLTVSGGAGVLIADEAAALGLSMPPLSEASQSALREAVPFSAPLNPIDCTAQVFNEPALISRFAETMLAEGGTESLYRSVLAFFSQTGGAPAIAPGLRSTLGALRAHYPGRLYALSVIAPESRVREYEKDGFLVFEEPVRAVRAIHAMGRIGAAFAAMPPEKPSLPDVVLPAQTPNEAEAKRLLGSAGIAIVPEQIAATAEEAMRAAEALGYPVVMKILSSDIPHKSEIGGVLLDLADVAAVREGFAVLFARARSAVPSARIEGVLVAREIRGARECILGVHRDPCFGPIAMFGLGGVFAEVLGDVVFHRCPFDEKAARQMIGAVRGAPLLTGVRGQRPADIAALAQMLARLSAFATAAGPRLVSIDLNPVLALPEEGGAFAADAVIEIGD